MDGVGARLGRHVHHARGTQIVGQIHGRLRDLKFLNGARRNVAGGRAYGLVGNVGAVHLDAGRTSEAPADGDRLIADLGGIEVGAVLDLHAGFELGEIQEVAPVDRQALNLVGRQHAFHRCGLGVHGDRAGLDVHRGRFGADLQLEVHRGVVGDLHQHLLLCRLETFGHNFHQVGSRGDGAGVVKAAAVGHHIGRDAGIDMGDGDLGAGNGRVAGVGDQAVDVAGGDRGLTPEVRRQQKENRERCHQREQLLFAKSLSGLHAPSPFRERQASACRVRPTKVEAPSDGEIRVGKDSCFVYCKITARTASREGPLQVHVPGIAQTRLCRVGRSRTGPADEIANVAPRQSLR